MMNESKRMKEEGSEKIPNNALLVSCLWNIIPSSIENRGKRQFINNAIYDLISNLEFIWEESHTIKIMICTITFWMVQGVVIFPGQQLQGNFNAIPYLVEKYIENGSQGGHFLQKVLVKLLVLIRNNPRGGDQ
jgi:hypothetical protein